MHYCIYFYLFFFCLVWYLYLTVDLSKLRIKRNVMLVFDCVMRVLLMHVQAAAHIHRFLSLDENVLRMSADASEGLFICLLRTLLKAFSKYLSSASLSNYSYINKHHIIILIIPRV